MATFTLTTIATSGFNVRAQLRAWLVPKKRQHELRVTQGIHVNGKYYSFNRSIPVNATVTLQFEDPTPPVYALDPGPLAIQYEDEQVLVVDKPAGMKMHPNQPGESGTLMNRVAAYLAPHPAYITHRLDMATSGLTLIAKDPLTQAIIDRELASKTMQRDYVAVTCGRLPATGTITAPIGRDPTDKRKRMVRPDGDAAVTHYTRLATQGNQTRVLLQLATGRTHQIRVHLASIGTPIVGDPLYNPVPAPRMRLHASRLTWIKPLSDRHIEVRSETPF